MVKKRKKRDWKKLAQADGDTKEDWRVKFFRYAMVFLAAVVVIRLFSLQVLDHRFYEALASGQHEIFEQLFPERGSIYVTDLKMAEPSPVATNQLLGFVYADPRRIENAYETTMALAEVLGYDEVEGVSEVEEVPVGAQHVVPNSDDLPDETEPDETTDFEVLLARLSKEDDPYEPVAHRVSEEKLAQINELGLAGIYYIREEARIYPEAGLGGQVYGFVGASDDGSLSGRYGLEGYFDELLSGVEGYLRSERDIAGRLIAVGDRSFEPAVDGADLVLSIDRTIQYMACSKIAEAVMTHGADSGSVVIVEPDTGRVLAMCAYPDYDPGTYNEVESIDIYNNPAIFNAYEPGSIFKPVTMAAALDSGAVTPGTVYEDTGEVEIDIYTIKNSDEEAHGIQTMTEVLEKSLNTGVIFAMRATGRDTFRDYVEDFGFGELTGIELDFEASGNVSSLDEISEIYPATASFGQGITATPIQLALAFAAIGNGGILYEPQVVDEINYADGTVESVSAQAVRRVISEKTSQLLSAMLVSVVEHGHGTKAGVEGYYVAGKTGTAQVPKSDGPGYEEDVTIGSFAGFAPADNPRFAMIVRVDRPRTTQWAEATAAPVFGELAAFLLQYLEVPPERNVN